MSSPGQASNEQSPWFQMRALIFSLLFGYTLSARPTLNYSSSEPEERLSQPSAPRSDEIIPGKFILWHTSDTSLFKRSRYDNAIRIGGFEALIVDDDDVARMPLPKGIQKVPVRTITADAWSTFAPWNLRVGYLFW